MSRALTPQQVRGLAISLLLVILVVVGTGVYIANQRWHRHYDEAIGSSLDHIGRYQRIISMRKEIEAGFAMVNAKNSRRFFLKNAGPALAAAEVQEAALEIITAHNLKIESTQISPHKDEAWRRLIAVNFKLRGKLNDLQTVLHTLETRQPWLYIDNLTIRSSVGRVYRPMPGIEPEITAQFDVQAYALIPSSSAKPVAAK